MGFLRPHEDLYVMLESGVFIPRGKEDVECSRQSSYGSDLHFSQITLATVGKMVWKKQAWVHVGRSLTGYCSSAGEDAISVA